MQRITAFAILLLLFTGCGQEAENPGSIFSITLQTVNDSAFSLSGIKNNKATVFVFLAVDCPLSQNYTLTLNNLYHDFKNDSIVFYGIIPGNTVTKKDVDDFVSKYKITFEMLRDDDLNLTHYLHATKTPEVFVVNKNGETVYKGAIDNWAIDIGKHRQYISEHYLSDVLTCIVNGTTIKIKETKAVGCVIEKNR
ncbi:MAG: redoxin domain-containing protein [Bacteroidia bacterium]